MGIITGESRSLDNGSCSIHPWLLGEGLSAACLLNGLPAKNRNLRQIIEGFRV